MDTKDVAVRDLRAFCRVIDLGSVTGAAATLGETKSAVSRRITRLEAALGVALVTRSARRVRPTEEGRLYRERAGRALALLDEAGVEVGGQQAEPSGVVRITAPPDLGVALLAPMMGELGRRYPQLTVDALLTEAVLPFAENALDLAIRVAVTLPDSSLVAHRLGGMPVWLVASPGHLQARGTPSHPDELLDHPFLAYRRPRGFTVHLRRPGSEVPERELRVHPRFIASDGGFLREAALAGAGIAALPAVFAAQAVAEGRLVRVLTDWELDVGARIYLLHAGGQALSAGVRAVRSLIREMTPAILEAGLAAPHG